MKNLNLKITCLILTTALLAVCLAGAAQASTTVKASASASQPKIGDTLTVTITVSDVQNLFGVDVQLNWNPNVLSLLEAKSMLGVESHPGGVLHESATDALLIVDDSTSKETGVYSLAATSTGAASAFTGSGTIAVLTFNVTSAGQTGLALQSKLADKPAADETSEFIQHTTSTDDVTTVVPEFSSITIISVLVIAVTAAALLVTKKHTKNP